MKKILILVGTRPNFIKVTQFKKLSQKENIDCKIVHTGQHFDVNMSDVFFQQLGLQPDFFLNIKSAQPSTQMGEIMMKLEDLIDNSYQPDLLMVPGDVNSTFAGALVANKKNIPLAHLESGLRSNDRNMPEEINRILTDEITDYYFVTEKSGVQNLKSENKKGIIYHVGNTMIDTLVAFENEINAATIMQEIKVHENEFVLMTVHRPSNVDSKLGLNTLLKLIQSLSKHKKIVLPLHPRTKSSMLKFGLYEAFKKINHLILTPAMGYFQFQNLVKNAAFIITDSGGVQEESTYRGVPCLTIRTSTERPITVEKGTNTLVRFDIEVIEEYIQQIENKTYKKGEIPEFWDGCATQRILKIIKEL